MIIFINSYRKIWTIDKSSILISCIKFRAWRIIFCCLIICVLQFFAVICHKCWLLFSPNYHRFVWINKLVEMIDRNIMKLLFFDEIQILCFLNHTCNFLSSYLDAIDLLWCYFYSNMLMCFFTIIVIFSLFYILFDCLYCCLKVINTSKINIST